jgi:hypothetical protein
MIDTSWVGAETSRAHRSKPARLWQDLSFMPQNKICYLQQVIYKHRCRCRTDRNALTYLGVNNLKSDKTKIGGSVV